MRRAPLLALLAVSLLACPREHASVEELYTTRTLGLGYLQRNQLDQAESTFTKLTKLAPDDPLGYEYLGLTYLQLGRYDDAEKQLKKARKIDPSSTESGLALARVYALTRRPSDARATLQSLQHDSANDAHVLYALATLDAQAGDSARYIDGLRRVLTVAPANLAARLALVQALAARGDADSAVRQLEEVRRIPPEPPKDARLSLDSAIQLLRAGKLPEARATIGRFVGQMETTSPYQASLEEVRWTDASIPGQPVLSFVPKSFISLRGAQGAKPAGELVKLVDATGESGLPAGPVGAVATGDVDGDGVDEVLISSTGSGARTTLYRVQGGFLRADSARSQFALPQGASFATFADYDNDGWLDLFAIGGEGRGHLFRNRGDGTFEDVTAKAGVGDVHAANSALFADLDQDGDLDLLLTGGQRTVYRNNLDGTFSDVTATFGLGAGAASPPTVGDFDGDGRLDVLIDGSLFRRAGAGPFTGTPGSWTTGGTVVAAADYDNDGDIDLLTWKPGVDAGTAMLWRNRGDGTFEEDRRSAAGLQILQSVVVYSASFVDYDNDGWLDLLVSGVPANRVSRASGLLVFHNDGTGRFDPRPAIVAASAATLSGESLPFDVDGDGDLDLLAIDGAGAPHLLRNDGGNASLAVDVSLKALRTGSGKNNTFGIGARLELRAGDIYQTRVVTSPVTHFGLGPHLKADVLRVEWPNGVPQTVYLPGTDQDVVEREMLKGSCGFVYTWDGTRFRFVTDAMWRSALGMPLGLMGGSSAYAPAGASQEYVRIPGEALVPRDGKYLLQLTEELWETAYADEVKLVAVDHPDSVDVFVDETFVPPGPVSLRLYQVGRREYPRSAVDERGADVLPALRATDDVYVSNMVPTKYQGVVEPHDLVLDLGPDAGSAGSHLFLRGWIYPTDASINVALGQQSTLSPRPPSLEVRDASGRWRVAIPSLGFPSGKDKTMIVDLAGKFPTSDHHVRLRTTMQIYWDEAFVARDLATGGARTTTLAPRRADLHARGFSRMYRKGGRYGPYWFDYSTVSTDNPWRPITGAFTRFGDVLPLLGRGDDMYVVMAPGDEATIEFDASSATTLPKGWKRDFLLYTDGWIKDSDLNTAYGTTVEPLPFHAAKSYPLGAGEAYPTDSAHQRFLREYQTRVVRPRVARGTR